MTRPSTMHSTISQTASMPVKGLQQRFFRRRAEDHPPLAISHHRIYILPSRRGWVFTFFLIIMLIASMNYAINLGFALCFLLTGLMASALLATYRNLAGLSLEHLQTSEAFAGGYLLFKINFRNPHHRERAGIKVSTDAGDCDIIHLQPKDHTDAEIQVPALQRGLQPLGRITLSTDYPLGLWYSWSYFHAPCSALIYPSAEADPPLPPGINPNTGKDGSKNRPRGDEEFEGLKTYQIGEPLSRIAWKAAARGQGWYSKAFTLQSDRLQHHFCMEDTDDLQDIEARLSRLTGWILRADAEGINYSLALPGYNSKQGCGNSHRDALLEELALFGLQGNA